MNINVSDEYLCFANLGIILGTVSGRLGVVLGPVWDRWGQFGIGSDSLGIVLEWGWDRFRVSVASVWCQFGMSLGTVLEICCEIS